MYNFTDNTVRKLKNAVSFAFSTLFLPALAGAFTGVWVCIYKVISNIIIKKSHEIYIFAEKNLLNITLACAIAALLALITVYILKRSPSAKGGGIPTAIAALRGFISIKWFRDLICVLFSSLITYFVGVPLGNEGPSVQMGSCIGMGCAEMSGKKHKALKRYIMTGGASAGFAVATGAPVSGIFFALEEAHRRFTPMIVLSSSVSVVSGFFIASALSNALGISISGFSLEAQAVLGINMFWIPVLMGICAGISNILILFSYKILKKFSNKLVDFPFTLRIIFIFILTVLIGMLSYNFTGSGHDVVEKIFTGSIVWYMLIIIFAVRCVMTLFSSISGVTGGLFLPTILFGALSASLCAKCIIASGAINQEYYTAMIVIGIAAFLGSAFKTPITAVIFAIEVFGGLNNSMFIVLGVYTSYFILETAGFASINDIVIEHKIGKLRKGKSCRIVEVKCKVLPGSFVSGKEARDILWPASCLVLSVIHPDGTNIRKPLGDGDEILMHIETYDMDSIIEELNNLMGEQSLLELKDKILQKSTEE